MSGEVSGDVNGLSIYFEPWTTEDWFSISILSIKESIGGSVAEGSMRLLIHCNTDSVLEKIANLNTGTIKIKSDNNSSNIIEIPIYIISKSHFNNFLVIKFICTSRGNDDFISKPISQSYASVEDAVSSYFPNYDCDVDPISELSSLPINQIGETGNIFCNKIVAGWKASTIFGYNLSGNLFIRDISKPTLESENKIKVLIGKTRFFTAFPNRRRSYLLDLQPYDPWDASNKDLEENLTKKDYSSYMPQNISTRVYRDSYNIFSKNISSLVEAASYNSRFYGSSFYSEGEIKAMTFPNYRAGDIVELTYVGGEVTKSDKDSEANPELISKNFLIGSFELFWTGQGAEGITDDKHLGFSVTSKIYGLDNNDINNNITNQ